MGKVVNSQNKQKKSGRKTKRRIADLWKPKPRAILSAVCAVLLWIGYWLACTFDNTVAAFMGGTFWKLRDSDPGAQYYVSDFSSSEEMLDYGREICRNVEEEGAALLLNENNALPLDPGARVSCFSTSSVNLVYGGSGSGNIDASEADNLREALNKSGIDVNDSLWDFYTKGPGRRYVRNVGGRISFSSAVVEEVPWTAYTEEVKKSVASYGDAVIVVLSRVGGEGADLAHGEVNYLALDQNERNMLAGVAEMKARGVVKKIVVLINSANALQVDFLKDNEYGIDACLWIGDPGISGINAVADILAGKVNPSGSLVDTYCYDNYSAPAMRNFTPTVYEGSKGRLSYTNNAHMIYQEGIYVGYKYYETRYEDAVMGTGNTAGYRYSDDVAFPFGYGLSYTDFSYSNLSVSYDAVFDRYEVRVTITNTGRQYFGKEPVQVYVQSPYTDYDRENRVEKPSVSLCGFGKTGMLAPGASEELVIYVDRRDIASYDAYGAGTYILDAGDYYLTVATDAHSAVNNILAAKGYGLSDGMDAAGDAALVYGWKEDRLDAETYSIAANGTPIANQLSESDVNLYQGSSKKITYLSRSDWAGTFPGDEPLKLAVTESLVQDLQNVRYDRADYPETSMPVTGADNGLKLYDMIGLEYDAPEWDKLLDQMTYPEMVKLIGDAFLWTMPIKSIEAPGTRDENGPQGLTDSLIGTIAGKLMDATPFPSEDVMAATFNVDLMTEVGKVIGNNCLQAKVACLYGPGNNIHRTPYGGRNFEYYSEDGFLSGRMSCYEVAAIQKKGVYVVMKHCALNDCEQHRIGLGIWLNEQAAREIYLKAFQAPVEEGNGGVMMAYTRWGTTWSGGNQGLGHILRDEWGCVGMIITDNALVPYVNGPDGLMAGTSIYAAMMPYVVMDLKGRGNDPVMVAAAREACHRSLYTIANSCAMNGMGKDTTVRITQPTILIAVRIFVSLFTVFALAMAVLWIRDRDCIRRAPVTGSTGEAV